MHSYSLIKLLPIAAAIALVVHGNASATTMCDSLSPEFTRLGDSYYDIEAVTKTHEESLRSRKRYADQKTELTSNRLKQSNRLHRKDAATDAVTPHPEIEHMLSQLNNLGRADITGELIDCRHGGGWDAKDRPVKRNRNDKDSVLTKFSLQDLELIPRSNGEHILTGYADDNENKTIRRMVIDIPAAERWEFTKNKNEILVREKYRKKNYGVNLAYLNSPAPDQSNPEKSILDNTHLNLPAVTAHLVEVELRMQQVGSEIELNRTIYINGHWSQHLTWTIDS